MGSEWEWHQSRCKGVEKFGQHVLLQCCHAGVLTIDGCDDNGDAMLMAKAIVMVVVMHEP